MRFNRPKAMFSALLACAVGALIYLPLEHSPYRTFFGVFAIGVGYTVVVFGLVWSNEETGLFTVRNGPLIGRMVVGHGLFLLLIAAVVEFGLLITPHLPDWLDEPLRSRNGRPAGTGFQLLQLLAFALVLFAEWAWLSLLVSQGTAPKDHRSSQVD